MQTIPDRTSQEVNVPVSRYDIWKKYPKLKQCLHKPTGSLIYWIASTSSVSVDIERGYDDINQYIGRKIQIKRLEYTGYVEADMTSWEDNDVSAPGGDGEASGNLVVRVFAWIDTRRDSLHPPLHTELCPLYGTPYAPVGILGPTLFPKECILLADKIMVIDAAFWKDSSYRSMCANGRTVCAFSECIDLDIEQIYGPPQNNPPHYSTNVVMTNPIYITAIANCRGADISGKYRGRVNVRLQSNLLYLDH